MKAKCLSLVLLPAGVALGLVERQHPKASPLSLLPGDDAVAAAAGDQNGPAIAQGGNGIFEIGLASDGNQALVVQSAEITSGVENDMLARFISSDGTLGPVINLTPWAGNQYKPRVAWDFGDGTISTDANPSHTYQTAWPYVVTLTVTDIYKYLYTFDAAGSVLSKSITK